MNNGKLFVDTHSPAQRAASRTARRRLVLGGLLLVAVAGGCASPARPTTEPTSWTDQATSDPGSFNPKMEKIDISGGGLTDFDRKAMGRDVDNVLNP
jgi:hypothetical protein